MPRSALPTMPPTIPELHDQFILHRPDRASVPAGGWRRSELGGWTLDSHPNLPVVKLVESDARHIGWLLGWAVTSQGWLLEATTTIAEATTDAAAVEKWLYSHGGRYVCVLLNGPTARLYLDPCGTLSAVYDLRRPSVASTLTLLRQDEAERFALEMAQQPEMYENHFFPAGLTADGTARRVLPNHYLDLNQWQSIRHWPAEPIERVGEEAIKPLVKRIAALVESGIRGIASRHAGYLGLTAGRDSRMLLACARPMLDRVRFVTFMYPDKRRRPDIHIARRIAKRHGLGHDALPLVEPTPEQRRQYLLRIGYAGHWGKVRDFDLACRRRLDLRRAWITGFGGEVGRAFYWRAGDEASHPPPPEVLMARLYLPRHDHWLAAWRQWQAAAPHRDTFDLLDLVYIEQRMGCWAGPHMYGAAPFAANIAAFNHREVLRAMMALPVAFRRTQGLPAAVLSELWPELGELPYQRLTGLERLSDPVHAALAGGMRAIRRSAGRALRTALGKSVSRRRAG